MNDLIIKIGKLVKEKRLEKGYSTQELADKLDVSAGLINNIENAKTDSFNFTFMENMCAALDISLLSMLATNPKDIMNLLSISPEIPEQLSGLNIPFEQCNFFGKSVRPIRKTSAGFPERVQLI